jgi:serine/threonine protein phosphatase PrpC
MPQGFDGGVKIPLCPNRQAPPPAPELPPAFFTMLKSSSLQIEGCALSHRGKMRSENQDAFVIGDLVQTPTEQTVIRDFTLAADGALAAVIDGMGGLGGGDIAAGALAKRWRGRRPASVPVLKRGLIEDHVALLAQARDSAHPLMGAVATGAMLLGAKIELFHVGDCRAYFVGPANSVLLTRDHVNPRGSLTQSFGGGEISGMANEIQPALLSLVWPREQTLLLASDGAWQHLPPEVISTVYAARPALHDFVVTLAGVVLAGPADDNLTLMALRPAEDPRA